MRLIKRFILLLKGNRWTSVSDTDQVPLQYIESLIIRYVQSEEFGKDFKDLEKHNKVKEGSNLLLLYLLLILKA